MTDIEVCPRKDWIGLLALSMPEYIELHEGFRYALLIDEEGDLVLEWTGKINSYQPVKVNVSRMMDSRRDSSTFYDFDNTPGVRRAMRDHRLTILTAYLYVKSFY